MSTYNRYLGDFMRRSDKLLAPVDDMSVLASVIKENLSFHMPATRFAIFHTQKLKISGSEDHLRRRWVEEFAYEVVLSVRYQVYTK